MMIKFQEVKIGDYVKVNYEGDVKRGKVTKLKQGEKQVCVDNGVQEFWYETDQLEALPVNEEELSNLKFTREITENGNIKFSKGAFRMLIPKEGDFSRYELWYRDEQRHIAEPINLHVLQNHFYDMTKVHLEDNVF